MLVSDKTIKYSSGSALVMSRVGLWDSRLLGIVQSGTSYMTDDLGSHDELYFLLRDHPYIYDILIHFHFAILLTCICFYIPLCIVYTWMQICPLWVSGVSVTSRESGSRLSRNLTNFAWKYQTKYRTSLRLKASTTFFLGLVTKWFSHNYSNRASLSGGMSGSIYEMFWRCSSARRKHERKYDA